MYSIDIEDARHVYFSSPEKKIFRINFFQSSCCKDEFLFIIIWLAEYLIRPVVLKVPVRTVKIFFFSASLIYSLHAVSRIRHSNDFNVRATFQSSKNKLHGNYTYVSERVLEKAMEQIESFFTTEFKSSFETYSVLCLIWLSLCQSTWNETFSLFRDRK